MAGQVEFFHPSIRHTFTDPNSVQLSHAALPWASLISKAHIDIDSTHYEQSYQAVSDLMVHLCKVRMPPSVLCRIHFQSLQVIFLWQLILVLCVKILILRNQATAASFCLAHFLWMIRTESVIPCAFQGKFPGIFTALSIRFIQPIPCLFKKPKILLDTHVLVPVLGGSISLKCIGGQCTRAIDLLFLSGWQVTDRHLRVHINN